MLRARTLGPVVPKSNFEGHIHSSFDKACNILCRDGALVTLTRPDCCALPNGIEIDLPLEFSFAKHINRGLPVGCRSRILRIQGHTDSIDLRNAEWVHGDYFRIGKRRSNIPNTYAYERVWRMIKQSSCFEETITLHYHLSDALSPEHLKTGNAQDILSDLLGRGPGLTPAGDDIIVGYLAASNQGNFAIVPMPFLSQEILAARTSDISRHFINQAGAGWFARPIVELVASFTDFVQTEELIQKCRVLLDQGHTSGIVTIMGILLGLTGDQRIQVNQWPKHTSE